MVGGGSRRDEGSLLINNTNVFAALETLRKKKKSDKDHGAAKSGKGSSTLQPQKQPEPEVFWAPAKLNSKSWADIEDEDDDDYYATAAPPRSVWGLSQAQEKSAHVEDSESEEDILGEVDEDDDEDHDHDHDHESEDEVQPEPVIKKLPEVAAIACKEPERQLSKKEKKKKELKELEALLADFGVKPKESNGKDELHEAVQEKKEGETEGDGEKKDNAAVQAKSSKKKKRKDKSSKETKESQGLSAGSDVNNGPDEAGGAEQVEEDASAVDMKERLKRMASAKKKKSSKEMDAAAKAAAQEAATRSAKLAAAKKKEKSHYNQQPLR